MAPPATVLVAGTRPLPFLYLQRLVLLRNAAGHHCCLRENIDDVHFTVVTFHPQKRRTSPGRLRNPQMLGAPEERAATRTGCTLANAPRSNDADGGLSSGLALLVEFVSCAHRPIFNDCFYRIRRPLDGRLHNRNLCGAEPT